MTLFSLIAILAISVSTGTAARVVCYFTNWSRYGSDPFHVEYIDPTLCTHVVYSFFGLTDEGYIESKDPWTDFGDEWTEGSLIKLIKLRNQNPSVKILLGVGGWNEGPLRFKSLVRSPEKRKTFLNSTLSFIRQYRFDGLEIEWIYQDSYGGNMEDKTGFSKLVQEMKPKYEDNKFLLSVATSAHPRVFDNSYDIVTLSKNVDFINVMSYDLHGTWDKKTGHVAPLHAMKGELPVEKDFNVEAVINRYIKNGAIPEKLNVGLVSYGRTFTLLDPNVKDMNAPSTGPGVIEPLPYRTFCVQDKSNFWDKYINEEQMVPYAVRGNQWVGYEDVASLKAKVNFGKSKKLGGISFWSLDFDDFRGNCGTKTYTLLRAVVEELNKY